SMSIGNGFTSNGSIELTSADSAHDATLTVSTGTLTNASGRTLSALAGTGGNRTLAAQLSNSGTLSVNAPLSIAFASAHHTSGGTILVGTGAALTVTQSGTSPSFTSTGPINV